MIGYIALLVGYDLQTSKIVYGGVEMVSDELPENNSTTIMEVVKLANNHPDKDAHLEYIDMYGYSYMGKKTIWEVSGTEEEFGGLNYD